ncbi:pyridoxamine 5'-phosphate oxidase family protein [Micromonospora narathiwatensis]|uniref:General stress protein 26 n=1 Tax=Micromonospora narathiwatensis TaxID=299146 RepID=A0A1A9A9G2_9ACTN|nr:pyridoxamine 5'-phosphate oxidase family protein [Micromonospora narathiwatensis]SBT52839.1 General stress protein 26 [Micromonospora narathiwatensis]
MTGSEPTAQLVEEFSEPGAVAPPWSDVVALLASSEMFWLSTVRRDGRPHVAPLPAMWLDDRLHFCTGAHEQKARNIEANANCVITTGTSAYRSGIDVTVEGTAERITDNATLERLARLWKDKLDWVFEVGDGVFLDTTGTRPAMVFAVRPAKVLAFSKNPYSQTRYVR